MPETVENMTIRAPQEVNSPFALSALPAEVAKEVEPLLATKGIHVVSNASPLRMEPDIPLLIPEINKDHLTLIDGQKTAGKIVTNPNCATVFITLAVAPTPRIRAIRAPQRHHPPGH